jgi:hypothetical protein
VLTEARLAWVAIVRHRSLREVASLVRLDDDTSTSSERCRDGKHD